MIIFTHSNPNQHHKCAIEYVTRKLLHLNCSIDFYQYSRVMDDGYKLVNYHN